MSAKEVQADEQYEAQNDQVSGDAPAGSVNDNSYIPSSSTGESKEIPVMKDDAPVEDPTDTSVDPNSDTQLARDDADAIDKSNIVGGRTRGAKPIGSYDEGKDEGDLPEVVADGDDGTSRVAQ